MSCTPFNHGLKGKYEPTYVLVAIHRHILVALELDNGHVLFTDASAWHAAAGAISAHLQACTPQLAISGCRFSGSLCRNLGWHSQRIALTSKIGC